MPKIVCTTYQDRCRPGRPAADVALLDPAQVSYLSTLVRELNHEIVTTIKGLSVKGVALGDTSNSMVGPDARNHRWGCAQPWAYGLSVFKITNPFSVARQAPFHLTSEGQWCDAALVRPVVKQVLGQR